MVTTMIALGSEFDFLPDDDEESLLGSSIHQDVIVTSYGSLKRHKRREQLPWFIGNQLMMIVPRQGGRPPYLPSPDVLVHPTLGDAPQTSLDVARVGPPALVIEVASPSTARSHDLDTLSPRAKPQVYARCGIAEYLVFDPLGDILPERVRAWRLGQRGGVPTSSYVPWLPDERGRWVSTALAIAIAPQGLLLRFYDGAGRLIPSDDELGELAEQQAREIVALRDELRRLRGE